MGCSKAQTVCANHADEIPQPGICPSCLRERLSRIISNYSTNYDSVFPYPAAASPVYYYGCYSASSSGGSSPARGRSQRRHLRVASDVMDSIYVAFGGGGLKKSRSMANYAPARDGGVSNKSNNNKKKMKKGGGFWNKLLLHSGGKKSKLW